MLRRTFAGWWNLKLLTLVAGVGCLALVSQLFAEPPAADATIRFSVRKLAAKGPADPSLAEIALERQWAPRETAIVICDVWNQHWCASATRRCGAIAEQIELLVEPARARGMHIVHAPSDTIGFYREHPARARALATPVAKPAEPIGGWCSLDKAREGELPIDDSDGGCDCQPQCKNYRAWSRQHPAIRIAETDVISDNGQEIYNYFVANGIKNVLYVGVHTNMCVLGRSFGIRQMTKLGLNTMLVRDLTDTMYNPRMRPFVEHAAGTDLVVRHVEQHWCLTTTSAALIEGLR